MAKKKHAQNYILIAKIVTLSILFLFSLYLINFIQHRQNPFPEAFSDETISIILKNQEFTLLTESLFPKNLRANTLTQTPFGAYGFKMWIVGKDKQTIPLNTAYLSQEIQSWEKQLGFSPSQEGSVEIVEGKLNITKPKTGTGVDRNHLHKALTKLSKTPDTKRNYTIFARMVIEKPKTNEREFEDFTKDISHFLSQDFHLEGNGFSIEYTLPQNELSKIIRFYFDQTNNTHVANIEPTYLQEKLSPFNREVVDAGFLINEDDTISIVPSQVGLFVDIEKTELNIQEAIELQKNKAPLALEIIEPDLSTEEAENLGIKHPVVSFTTYFACCEARAKNIKAVADIVDSAIVLPNQEWNLNAHIGKRTPERGFLPAGTIVKGSMIETVGGGISQFATTFYNAVYWGGYKDISHTPHSRYFPRYPEGIEATISWPKPDLIFQNNGPYGILIDTQTTPTSVTVRFFGNNDGRYIQGKHKDGKTILTTINEGGEDAKIVESRVENKTDIYPQKEIYYVDPLREPNAIFLKTEGRPSYSVDVIRTIQNKGGEILETNKWKTYYLSEDKEYLVQTCDVAPPGSICKTQEDIEKEKQELQDFFAELESKN